jgi:hypothetical protein
MQDAQKHLPATVAQIAEMSKIKYLQGRPRSYRFDGSKGYFKFGEDEPITKKCESIKIITIAYRAFKDAIFNSEEKRDLRRNWLEIFYYNASGILSVVLFHDHSYREFERMYEDLVYDEVGIHEVEITITPREMVSKASGSKWYLATFKHRVLGAAEVEAAQALIHPDGQLLKIYRSESIQSTAEEIMNFNFANPLCGQIEASEAIPGQAEQDEPEEFVEAEAKRASRQKAEK